MDITVNDLIKHGEEIVHTLTYQSYQHNRDAGMPYRPTKKSIWGKDNEQLEARYQYDKELEQEI